MERASISATATCSRTSLENFRLSRFVREALRAGDVLEVREEDWRDPTLNLYRFDDFVDEHATKPTTLRLVGSGAFVAEQGLGVVTRCQRCIDRRNAASRAPLFDAALARLPVLYDCQKPLCRADYRHALDAWQWLLRLDRYASLEVQLSVLLHDIERTVSEADRRVEHRAADYTAFKYAHAAGGASSLGAGSKGWARRLR